MSVRIGVIGLGNMGQRHIKSALQLGDLVQLAAVADPDASKRDACAASHAVPAYEQWDQMLDQAELDAVIIACAAVERLAPIEAAAKRKIAIFCEKPPALTMADAQAAANTIRENGIINTVGFQYRWDPLASRMRELVASSQPLFARIMVAWNVFGWVRDGAAPLNLYRKNGCGGPFIEQGIHFQDVLRYIVNDEPSQVHAMAELGNNHPTTDRDCEETSVLTVKHAGGLLTSHVHNWSHRETCVQLELVGVDYHLTWTMEGNRRLTGTIDGQTINETADQNNYETEIHGFIKAVAERDQQLLRSSYADACRSLATCFAAERSLQSGTAQNVDP